MIEPIRSQSGAARFGRRAAIAEVPSFGARRPGPIDLLSGGVKERARRQGFTPIQLQIPDAGVDAPVEVGTISEEGVMLDPSGPWVVTWYDVLGKPGEGENVVMAAHVDYWEVGPAVFQAVPGLQPGAGMTLLMQEDGAEPISYAMDSLRLYDVRTELTPEVIQTEVVGPTGREALTLITCGGEFDGTEYLQRWVLRAYAV